MIPSRLDYRCIKSGVGTGELGTVVTEFDSRHFDIHLSPNTHDYLPRFHDHCMSPLSKGAQCLWFA